MYVFENLNLFQSAVGFAALVDLTVEGFPLATRYFVDRIRNAANSIPAHIAEAHGHWKEEECREFFWKAREATQDCAGLVEIAARQKLIEEPVRTKLRARLDTLQKMIQDSLHQPGKKEDFALTGAGPAGLSIL